MNIAVSVSSKIDFVNFRSLTSEEIRALSVKRIENELTLDTLLHPTPGGLYDPALGAWEDNTCTTCNLRKFACPGHPGHIELPVVVYHPTYIDQLLKLMNAQCAYCGGFTIAKGEALRMKCKLRLLRYGLIREFHEFDMLDGRNPDAVDKSDTKDEVVEEDFRTLEEDVPSKPSKQDKAKFLFSQTKSRIAFVNAAVKRAKAEIRAGTFVESEKHEAVYAARRDFVKECIAVLSASRPCGSCLIKSPRFRKDGYNKIFRKPLSGRDLAKVMQAGRERLNALTSVKLAKEKARQQRQQDREVDEAISMNDTTDSQEDSEIEETTQSGKTTKKSQGDTAPASGTPEYMTPQEVFATMTMLFEKEGELLSYIYDSEYGANRSSTVKADMLFMKDLLVPPNRFRPVAMASGQVTEAQQNSLYKKILKSCVKLQDIQRELAGLQQADGRYRRRTFDDFKRGWIELQDNVNSLIDTDRNPMKARMKLFTEEGIKQKLEKKEGLFRQNMMGKRVNFAARSVISPDVNLEPSEIGVPPVFAKKLTFPEPVTDHNYKELREAVLNGVDKWPGAAAIENENGQVINLRLKNFEERQALANQLMTPSNASSNGSTNKKVHRHLANGDFVIMNRQPTLHKPSMMTHKVRVLPGEKTIRMHYANCKAYNADFDGDEMNMHFPQNEIARAEAMQLSNTDSQYLVATFGEPLRGLIQDHLSMGVWLCNKDTFFKRGDYYQLIYAALRADDSRHFRDKVKTVPPSILKPYPMWTGKQLVSTVLLNITPEFQEPLNMSNKTKVKASYWSSTGASEEAMVLVQEGELMHGILDKSHLGPAENGFVHAIYEAYGKTITTKALGILGRLLTKMLHMKAFSCGMEDITLTEEGDKLRRGIIEQKKNSGHEVAAKFVLLEANVSPKNRELDRRLEEALRDDQKQSLLDTLCKVAAGEITTEITRTCLPKTLWKHFPKNQMQNMTVSGAKGSDVNANLISCSLGQQVLEGRRVPVMASGKTLPSFKPFETMLRAGGYVTNRFLSGVQPQEYYFHTMGGREGLIDTAVKTSRSGYLQRCVIKGMEGLKVQYDTSVRDIDGGIVQFLYGEDGLDITRQKNLTNFKFNAQNFLTLLRGMPAGEQLLKFFSEDARELNAKNFKNIQKGRLDKLQDPVTAYYNPANTGGSVSETFYAKLKNYLDKNPEKLIKDKKTAPKGQIAKANFTHLLELKYMQSLVDPGEAVGVIAGQSIGEPSTQMTLNTFHLAGVSGKNVTLGIPRLREIVMTASSNISTPNMSLYLNPELEDDQAHQFSKGISRLTLAETLETVKVKTSIGKNALGDHARLYSLRLNTYPAPEYRKTYGITTQDVFKTICVRFVPTLLKKIKKQFQEKGAAKYAKMDIGKAKGKTKMGDGDEDADDDDDDGAAEMGDGGLVDDIADEATDDEVDSEVDEDNDDGKPSGRAGAYGLDEDDTEAIRQAHDAAEVDVDSDNESPNARAAKRTEDSDAEDDQEEVRRSKKASFDKVRDVALRLYQNLRRLEFDHKTGESCVLDFEFDIQSPKILMLNLAEVACKETVIQDVPGVKASFVSMETVHDENGKERQIPCITTEGINIPEMRNYQHIINPHKIFTNDIAAVLKYYGVEACRATIIRETGAIFKGHGIDVDDRHLILVADTMTRGGGFAAFSRIGMKHATSPFSKMSFETTVGFMKEAVLDNDWDDLSGPSARIVMGQPSCVGTGAFDVFTQLT